MKSVTIETNVHINVGPYTDCYTLYCPLCQEDITLCDLEFGEVKCNRCKIEIRIKEASWVDDCKYDIIALVVYRHIPPLIPYKPLPTPSYVKVKTTEKIKEELKERYKVEDLHE